MVAREIEIKSLWLRFRFQKTESLCVRGRGALLLDGLDVRRYVKCAAMRALFEPPPTPPSFRYLLSCLWLESFSGISWHFFDVTACLLAITGFAFNAPAAAAAHALFGLTVIAGVLVLAAGRQLLLTRLMKYMRDSNLRLSSAQFSLMAKSVLSWSLIALVSAWACALGLIHLPAVALIVVALCNIDINAHTFDPVFTLAMTAAANLLHFVLFVVWGQYAPVTAACVDGIPSVIEALVVLPLIMGLLQAQVPATGYINTSEHIATSLAMIYR